MRKTISVTGARANNLQNIDVEIPRDKLTVVTGVSGSGKTSLAFDVVFAEGQRKFLESMSSSARRRISIVDKADVDSVKGLSPVIAIQQSRGLTNPRSTVGTMTEIFNYLRLLFATIGQAHCPYCQQEISTQSKDQVMEKILSLPETTRVELAVPVFKVFGEDYEFLLDEIRSRGYMFIYINGKKRSLSEAVDLDDEKDYSMQVVIDEFAVSRDIEKNLLSSIDEANRMGHGSIQIKTHGIPTDYFDDFGCSKHGIVMHEQMGYDFSFNHPTSACETCRGLGLYLKAEANLLIKKPNKGLRYCFTSGAEHILKLYATSLAKHYNFDIKTPFEKLSDKVKDVLFYGTKGEKIELVQPYTNVPNYIRKRFKESSKEVTFDGLVPTIDRWFRQAMKEGRKVSEGYNYLKRFMREITCQDCSGAKLRQQKLLQTINNKTIFEIGRIPISELNAFLNTINVPQNKNGVIAQQILKEIRSRVELLDEIGLGYIDLNRRVTTLSGGEEQRIKLSTQISSELIGMLYVLDEPTIGLHQKDNTKLIATLKKLRDIGNTVIIIEHDLETIGNANHIIEMGPGPGIHGGQVVAQGELEVLLEEESFLTGQYISGKRHIPVPKKRRRPNGMEILIRGARENNLKGIDVRIPLNMLVCVTGISGSGKSSLINEILVKKLMATLRDPRITPGEHSSIEGLEHIVDIRNINQSPIGYSKRSNPATYIGIYDKIRDLFADLPLAKEMELGKKYFSFNNKEGRCSECAGLGLIKTNFQFMADVEFVCPICHGNRYSNEVLEVTYKGVHIGEIFEMSVGEGREFFSDINLIHHKLSVLEEVGLGYLKLGQPTTTLSGGEAQRLKIANELAKIKELKGNLYVLDEPSTGLHIEDVTRLLESLNRLIEAGNTVLIIEHNLEIIKTADYVIDLGPEGGKDGGFVIAEGPPEEVAKVQDSYTGQYLKQTLEAS